MSSRRPPQFSCPRHVVERRRRERSRTATHSKALSRPPRKRCSKHTEPWTPVRRRDDRRHRNACRCVRQRRRQLERRATPGTRSLHGRAPPAVRPQQRRAAEAPTMRQPVVAEYTAGADRDRSDRGTVEGARPEEGHLHRVCRPVVRRRSATTSRRPSRRSVGSSRRSTPPRPTSAPRSSRRSTPSLTSSPAPVPTRPRSSRSTTR